MQKNTLSGKGNRCWRTEQAAAALKPLTDSGKWKIRLSFAKEKKRKVTCYVTILSH
jgi:hypothetical protein